MESKTLKAACLGAALATAWAGPTAAEAASTIKLDFTLNTSGNPSVSHGLLAYSLNSSGTGTVGGFTLIEGSPVEIPSNLNPEDFNRFAVIGLVSPGHVAVSMASGANAIDTPFEAVFPGYNEATIAGYLASDDPAADAFAYSVMSGPYGQIFGSAADMIQFSNGQPLGGVTASSSPVPEPAALLGVILGGTGFLVRRRR